MNAPSTKSLESATKQGRSSVPQQFSGESERVATLFL